MGERSRVEVGFMRYAVGGEERNNGGVEHISIKTVAWVGAGDAGLRVMQWGRGAPALLTAS